MTCCFGTGLVRVGSPRCSSSCGISAGPGATSWWRGRPRPGLYGRSALGCPPSHEERAQAHRPKEHPPEVSTESSPCRSCGSHLINDQPSDAHGRHGGRDREDDGVDQRRAGDRSPSGLAAFGEPGVPLYRNKLYRNKLRHVDGACKLDPSEEVQPAMASAMVLRRPRGAETRAHVPLGWADARAAARGRRGSPTRAHDRPVPARVRARPGPPSGRPSGASTTC